MCGGGGGGGSGGGGFGGHCDENWTTLLAWVAFVFSLPRVPAVQCRGWLAGSGKRTHLLYEIISDQIQHRMSPVWRDSGGREGGGITGRRGTYVSYVRVGVWYGGELHVFPSHLVTVVFMSLCLM